MSDGFKVGNDTCPKCFAAHPSTYDCTTHFAPITPNPDAMCERLRLISKQADVGYYAMPADDAVFILQAAERIQQQRAEIADLKHDLDRYMKIANIEYNEAEDAKAAIASLQAVPAASGGGWQPIEDEPPVACHLLVTKFDDDFGEWLVAVKMREEAIDHGFTHWRPLPAPPSKHRERNDGQPVS